jgi:hypothetical protein
MTHHDVLMIAVAVDIAFAFTTGVDDTAGSAFIETLEGAIGKSNE